MSARALYIRVDVHEKGSQVAVYERGGELLQEKRLPTRGLARFVSSLHGTEKHVGIESVGFIYPIYDALLKAGCESRTVPMGDWWWRNLTTRTLQPGDQS